MIRPMLLATVALGLAFLLASSGGTPVDPRNDDLAVRFRPLNAMPTSTGPQTVPFHAYNGDLIILWTHSNAAYVEQIMTGSGYRPLKTTEGTVPTLFWLPKYHDSTCGAYSEFVVSFLTVQRSDPAYTDPLPVDAIRWTELFTTDPHVTGWVWKLWVSNAEAQSYGRDLLGLDKARGVFNYNFTSAAAAFSGTVHADNKDRTPLLDVKISAAGAFKQLSTVLATLRTWSWSSLKASFSQSEFWVPVASIKGIMPPHMDRTVDPVAIIALANKPPVLQFWDSDVDSFAVGVQSGLQGLQAKPLLIQRAQVARFVYFPVYNVPPLSATAKV